MPRRVQFERLHNVRDVGGYEAAGGRTVRRQRLYRADALSKLDGKDLDRFTELGVRIVAGALLCRPVRRVPRRRRKGVPASPRSDR